MSEAAAGERRSSGARVIVTLFLLAIMLGAVAFWRFTRSDRFIQASLAEVQSQAAQLTPEECVGWAVSWAARCQAMKALCEGSIPRIVEACLMKSDRHAFCASLGDTYRVTSFGVAQCRARLAKRDGLGKKACALSYGAIARYCERLRRAGSADGYRSPRSGEGSAPHAERSDQRQAQTRGGAR
jgi:hypothetical protein